jgi:hypothetical protein
MSRVSAALAHRHDAYMRREISDRHERLARLHEVGGEFSTLP